MEEFSIQFEATIIHYVSEQNISIEIMLCHKDRLLAKDTYQVLNSQTDRLIILSDPGTDDFRNELLWSPKRPTLIDATIRQKNGDIVLDEFTSYTALRSVNILRDRFMLNERLNPLRMVLDQGY